MGRKPAPPAIARCGWCATEFEPTKRQLGQAKRGHILYCKSGCYDAADKARMSRWWRSPQGKKYNQARNKRARRKA